MPTRSNKINTTVTAEAKAGKAHIRIVDYIGASENGADSKTVRALVDAFLQNGIKEAAVYINSRGGSVFEGVEITNELGRFTKVEIELGALAASAATYPTSHFYTRARQNTQLMIHRPRLYTGGDVVTIEADLKLLRNLTDDYKQKYAAKTGKTVEEIEAMWSTGDVWMTANEALANGFIDEVIQDADAQASAEDIAILEACGAPNIPTPKTTDTMDKMQVIAALGLPADSTDEQVYAAAKAAKEKADQQKAAELDAKAQKEVAATALVTAAVNAKKIGANMVDTYKTLAMADFDAAKKALEALPVIPQLSAQLNPKAKGENEGAENEPVAGWTLQDYLDKDPEALQKLYSENPEAAAKLEQAYFKDK